MNVPFAVAVRAGTCGENVFFDDSVSNNVI